MTLHHEVHGPADGPAVLLLHGFPDTGRLWRNQVPALVDAGYRVIVPDQRGYGRSDKPAEVGDYNLLLLAGDALELLDALGVAQAAVVGHDWGAAVTWALASAAPERVSRAAVLSVGHPASFNGAGYEQHERSWYMLLFQFEGVAERWLSDDGWANFRAYFAHPDADAVVAALEADGSLTPALDWYRANVPPEALFGPPPELPPISVPVLGIWSSGDRHLTESQMTGSAEYCAAGFRYERIDGPGHWLQLEAPARVNELLLDFLA